VVEYIREQLWNSNELFEYAVVPVRQTLIGDKVNVAGLQELISGYAYQGWHIKSVTDTTVAGRVGPGGVGGLLIIFERRVIDTRAFEAPPS
jgi:hypothetical protein